jgi:hypothetical protein
MLSNSYRIMWEDNMFNNIYNNAIPFDRCKYGCLNTNKKNKTILCAIPYGNNYLILKSHMRARVTCCYGDSGNGNGSMQLGTLENYAHVLEQFRDNELKNIVSLACDIRYVQKAETTYKEIQIHGPISIYTDIETLVLNKSIVMSKEMIKLVNNFKSRGIKIIYTDT